MKDELKVFDIEVSPPNPKQKWVYQRLVMEVPEGWEMADYYDHGTEEYHSAVDLDNDNGHRVVVQMRRKLTDVEQRLLKKAREKNKT